MLKMCLVGQRPHKPYLCRSSVVNSVAPTRRPARGYKSSKIAALGSRDETTASIDDISDDTQDKLIREVQRIEVEEPAIEQKGENAALYVAAAVAFGAGVWGTLGRAKGEEYFAGYLLEQSLSVDNLFVFILVFNYFKTPLEFQNKVLTWGLLTAAALRLVLIVLGADIVDHFQPVLLLFSAILLYSSIKLLTEGDDEDGEEELANNKIVNFCKSLFTFTDTYDGDNFFVVKDGVRLATPLLLVLLVIELSDVVFAVDSIPAVFGVTTDPFIVYTSNLFAILSLRGLYGFVASFMSKVRYLDKAVALVLGFVGAKIILDFAGYKIPTDASLGVVASILAAGVATSFIFPEPEEGKN